MKQGGLFLVLYGTAVLAGTPPPTWATASDADRCEAAKNRVAGQYYLCREKAEARAILTGEPADYARCTPNFEERWDRAESNGGGTCPDNMLTAAMNAYIAGQASQTAAVIAGASVRFCAAFPATGQTTPYGSGSDGDAPGGAALSYTDNGDGTITDNNTGLMWEKKDNSGGGIHDKDNTYTWSEASYGSTNIMDGTIATFLATLNTPPGFAGHTDWRIPNYKELTSILNLELTGPSVSAAFHDAAGCPGCSDVTVATCTCTRLLWYWSSTTTKFTPTYGYIVSFGNGFVDRDFKNSSHPARAVRGGL